MPPSGPSHTGRTGSRWLRPGELGKARGSWAVIARRGATTANVKHQLAGHGRIQPVCARNSATFSDGVMNPRVLRGRMLRLAAMRARTARCTHRAPAPDPKLCRTRRSTISYGRKKTRTVRMLGMLGGPARSHSLRIIASPWSMIVSSTAASPSSMAPGAQAGAGSRDSRPRARWRPPVLFTQVRDVANGRQGLG